jgi:uncharacterized membrane protein YgdD (TMEM256/DUF423 family)
LNRALFLIAALYGLSSVLLGAFGAHGLEGQVSAQRLAVWETGAHYLGWHATTLLVITLFGTTTTGSLNRRWLAVAGWAIAAGCLLFSGSLFVLVLTDTPAWGAVTPFGGLALAGGWLALLVGLLLGRRAGGDRR